MKAPDLRDDEYKALAEFRFQIRRFLTFSEAAAREAGVEPQQHQLLLALRSLDSDQKTTIRSVAQRLLIAHNSAVELVNRAVERGLVERRTSEHDHREVSLRLTRSGHATLRKLSVSHRAELRAASRSLVDALRTLVEETEPEGS